MIPKSLVEIVNITHKDGTQLEPENWRQKLIGRVTICRFIGSLGCMTPFFQTAVYLENGKVTSVNLHYKGNASSGPRPPIEVEPNLYDFESNTSLYRFRVLSEEECDLVLTAIRAAYEKEVEELFSSFEHNNGSNSDIPAS